MRLYRRKRRWWEYFVVGFLVAASTLLGLSLYAGRDRLYKERLLILELEGMRRLVAAQMLEKRIIPKKPPWENAAAGAGSGGPGAAPKLDPFGTPYHYNPEKGRVSSETKGYGSW